MCDIVWVSPQEHWSESESFHLFLQALQWPCPVRKRFRRDRCCRGRAKPGCRIVGSSHEVCIDHPGQLPGFSPLTVDVNWFRLTPQRLSGCQAKWLMKCQDGATHNSTNPARWCRATLLTNALPLRQTMSKSLPTMYHKMIKISNKINTKLASWTSHKAKDECLLWPRHFVWCSKHFLCLHHLFFLHTQTTLIIPLHQCQRQQSCATFTSLY